MLADGIIMPIEFPFPSPVVLWRKNNGISIYDRSLMSIAALIICHYQVYYVKNSPAVSFKNPLFHLPP